MKRTVILFLMTMIACVAVSQEVTLRFTCRYDNGTYHPFDRVQVTNTTQGWSQTLTYPDTVLTVTYTAGSGESITIAERGKPVIGSTYPNPFDGQCSSVLQLAEGEEVTVEVVSLTGAVLSQQTGYLAAGEHKIEITLGEPQVAILRVRTSKGSATTKLYNTARGAENSIVINTMSQTVSKAACTETFTSSDVMTYRAYSVEDGVPQSSYTRNEALGDGGEKILIFSTDQNTSDVFDENGVHFKTFSVSTTRSVRFSKGNLQYTTLGTHTVAGGGEAVGTWRFAQKQYLFAGADNANIASDYTGWIDMFGWGTSGWSGGITACYPWSTSGNTNYYCIAGNVSNSMTGNYANADWGVYNAISNGGDHPGMWRTLTKEEWIYLLRTRSCSTVGDTPNARYAKATVCDVCGMMLFPDTYIHPSGVAIPTGINVEPTTSGIQSFFADNVYDSKAWEQLERAGVIFLPAAGRRVGTNTVSVGAGGFYWSATGNAMPYDISYTDSYLYICGTGDRSQGRTVRLVYDEQTDGASQTVGQNKSASSRTLYYAVDGEDRTVNYSSDGELNRIMQEMTRMVRNGHVVTFSNKSNRPRPRLGVETITFTTRLESEAIAWCKKMCDSGYTVEMRYVVDTKTYHCTATRQHKPFDHSAVLRVDR